MKQQKLILMFISLATLFLTTNVGAAMIAQEATEIPFQVSYADRIIIGTVTGIDVHKTYTIFTISVNEWLYNPLPTKLIKIRTESGTELWTEDELELSMNESVLLMLKNKDLNKKLFKVPLGIKYPVSDRDEVIKELMAQGKLQERNETLNETSDSTAANNSAKLVNTENQSWIQEIEGQELNKSNNKTARDDERMTEEMNSTNSASEPKNTPFISLLSTLVMFGAVVYLRVRNK